jgi:hypothetical protein
MRCKRLYSQVIALVVEQNLRVFAQLFDLELQARRTNETGRSYRPSKSNFESFREYRKTQEGFYIAVVRH